MAEPIELVKGGERQTVYSDLKAAPLEAEGWVRVRDLTPEQQEELANRPAAPWRGYDDMNVEEVLAQANTLDAKRRQAVLDYERAMKNRKGVVEALGGTVETEEQPPVTVETVVEQPLQTTETVEIKPANDVPGAIGQGRLARGRGRSSE